MFDRRLHLTLFVIRTSVPFAKDGHNFVGFQLYNILHILTNTCEYQSSNRQHSQTWNFQHAFFPLNKKENILY